MSDDFTPDITFALGPPGDPVRRALFDAAQTERFAKGRSAAEAAVAYEPRLPILVEERDGEPSTLSRILSEALGAPVRVRAPDLSFGYHRGVCHAALCLRPEHVEGPPSVVRALFEEGHGAHEVSCLLGFVLKLDWVWYLRPLGPPEPLEAETEDGVEEEGTP
jgi:hypothetical protein